MDNENDLQVTLLKLLDVLETNSTPHYLIEQAAQNYGTSKEYYEHNFTRARLAERIQTQDIINAIVKDFFELKGDHRKGHCQYSYAVNQNIVADPHGTDHSVHQSTQHNSLSFPFQ